MEDVRVAAVAMTSLFGRTSENIAIIKRYVNEAADSGVNLICFPEASITGYSITEKIFNYAETIPGPGSLEIIDLSKSTGVAILTGLIEKGENNSHYISQLAAFPNGEYGVYRKTHLSPKEEELFIEGDDVPVFKFGNTIFGIQLCYDSHFPELTTRLTEKGVDILFISFASPRETPLDKRNRWLRFLQARAYDNSIYVVACNQAGENKNGESFPGVSIILDPKGNILTEEYGTDENMIVADLNKDALNSIRESKMGYFFNRRRPEIYGDFTKQ